MKCKSCIYYMEKQNRCEIGKRKDTCRHFRSISKCLYNCNECPEKDSCDRAVDTTEEYIEKYTRYNND